VLQNSPYKQPFSFPRRIFAPGLLHLGFAHPDRGVGAAPRVVRVQRHPWGVPWRVKDARERALGASKTHVTALVAPLRYALHRVRDTRSLVQSLYFPVFLQIRTLPSPVSRSQAHTPPRSRGAFSAPGVCILASLTPNRGVGGAPRDVRVRARHPCGVSCASKTRVNALMTRYARRLRGALRPIARQDARERAYDAGRSPLGAPPWRLFPPLIPAKGGIQHL